MAVSEAVHRLHNKIGGENLAAVRMSGHLHIHRRLHVGGNVAGAVVEDNNGQVAAHPVKQGGERWAVGMHFVITANQHQTVSDHHHFITQEPHTTIAQRLRVFFSIAIEFMIAERGIRHRAAHAKPANAAAYFLRGRRAHCR